MEVKVWGYLKEYAENKEEILKAVEEVFESGQLILGNKVQLFEKTYAAYCGEIMELELITEQMQ